MTRRCVPHRLPSRQHTVFQEYLPDRLVYLVWGVWYSVSNTFPAGYVCLDHGFNGC